MAIEKPMRVVRSEDLEARLRDLVGEAMAAGREASAAATAAGQTARRYANKPGGEEELLNGLRQALEDEVEVAAPAAGESAIDESEVDREIAKRALMHLKLPTLREIAESMDLPRSGNLEEVIDRIARELRSDPYEIARLIVKYETEPAPERRFASRIFNVREPLEDPEQLSQRIDYLANRYIRTGIARWVVFEDVRATPVLLSIDGTFRSYRADAERFDDDYRLRADPHSAPASLRMFKGEKSVEIRAKGELESKAFVLALQRASSFKWEKRLPISQSLADGELWGWHPWSIFLVDLLNARFRSSNVEIFDMFTAGFRTAKEASGHEDDRPAVRSVRFQGRHLLDSLVACDLIVSGQALAELGMTVRYRHESETYLLPLTIKLAEDHATVLTSFGLHDPAIAGSLHREIVQGLRKSLRNGLANEGALIQLAVQIRERAESEETPDHPTIFGPDPVSGQEVGD